MKSMMFLGIPTILLVVLHFMLHSGAEILKTFDTYAVMLPLSFFGLALLLSLLFGRSKLVFLSVLFGGAAFHANLCYFTSEKAIVEENFVLFAVTALPILSIVIYYLRERGVFGRFAIIQLVLVSAAVAFMTMTASMQHGGELPSESGLRLLAPISELVCLPMVSLVVIPLCFLAILLRKERESALTGPLVCLSILFLFAALNCRSKLWDKDYARAAMALFMTGSAMTIIWSVLEGSWRSATIDRLTELPGRRAFDARLDRLAGSYVLAMADVDRFKKINDKYGHPVGDQVLRYIASVLNRVPNGTCYRYGGEEFVIVFPRKDLKAMMPILEGLREKVKSRSFVVRGVKKVGKTNPGKKGLTVTVSIGAAEPSKKHSTPAEVLAAADKALYTAKRAGRNKVKKAR